MIMESAPVWEVVCALASQVMLCLAFIMHPSHATCPTGWYAEGVRPGGQLACRPVVGQPERDIDDARAGIQSHDERVLQSRVYCTGGSHPIVIDARTIGCQR